MGMISEFKEFAAKGNVVDLAVGVIIGAAFGKIVSSLVDDIIMPPIGLIISGIDFSKLAIVLKEATPDKPAVAIHYGLFLNAMLTFIIVAFCVFLVVKAINSMRAKQEVAVAIAPPVPSKEELLLTDIRDILRSK